MMRLLMITASAGHGGGPQHLLDLAESLRGQVEVNIACPKQEPFYNRFGNVIDGQLFEIPERRFTFFDALKLLVFAKKRKVDLIHSHGKGAGVYGRAIALMGGMPVVHTLHGVHVDHYSGAMRQVYLIYERLTRRINSRTILVSPSEYDAASQLGIVNRESSCVIHNGVTSQDRGLKWTSETRRRIRDELNLHKDDFVVVSLSRFDHQKNMPEAFEIARELSHIKFLMLGYGEDFSKIKKETEQNAVGNVILPGFVNNPLDYLVASDAYLSTSRWEGMPLALLEAMSVSLPVIASDVVGNRDAVFNEDTGYLYQLGNIKEASNYIQAISSDPNVKKKMGERGRDCQQKLFSVSQMAFKTRDVYQAVLSDE